MSNPLAIRIVTFSLVVCQSVELSPLPTSLRVSNPRGQSDHCNCHRFLPSGPRKSQTVTTSHLPEGVHGRVSNPRGHSDLCNCRQASKCRTVTNFRFPDGVHGCPIQGAIRIAATFVTFSPHVFQSVGVSPPSPFQRGSAEGCLIQRAIRITAPVATFNPLMC